MPSCVPLAVLALLGLACGAVEPTLAQPCAARSPGDLVLTEYLNDPEGLDTGAEYVELYNPSAQAVELAGLTLFASRADGSQEKVHLIREAFTVAPGTHVVLGDVRAPALPEHVDLSYGDALGALPNGAGRLGIRCGETLLDEVSIFAPAKPGASRVLDGSLVADSARNDLPLAWCDAAAPTPGAPNPGCGSSSPCLDPETKLPRPVRKPAAGDVVISEWLADPHLVPDATGEWIELSALAPLDLNGLTLVTGRASTVLHADTCLSLPAGGLALLARDTEPTRNGNLPPAWGPFAFALTNGGAALELRGEELTLDTAPPLPSEPGIAWQRSPTGFCLASAPSPGGARAGTPGQANPPCAVSPAGLCRDGRTGALRPIEAARAGDLVITEFLADPAAASDEHGEWVELFATRTVDLQGLALGSDRPWADAHCLQVEAGTHVVLARSADPRTNGALPAVLTTFSAALPNAGPHTLRLARGGEVIDALAYESPRKGVAQQLDSRFRAALHNDSPAHFCAARLPYGGGDLGTPGQPNAPCAP